MRALSNNQLYVDTAVFTCVAIVYCKVQVDIPSHTRLLLIITEFIREQVDAVLRALFSIYIVIS